MAVLQCQMFTVVSSWLETWHLAFRQGAQSRAESSNLDPHAARRGFAKLARVELIRSQSLWRTCDLLKHTMTHFIQPGYTYSGKGTSLNSATPYEPDIQRLESLVSNSIQTTTVHFWYPICLESVKGYGKVPPITSSIKDDNLLTKHSPSSTLINKNWNLRIFAPPMLEMYLALSGIGQLQETTATVPVLSWSW